MKIILKHDTGLVKEVKKGFSWTVFFFGFFVPLIRGDLKWATIMFLLESFAGSFTFGIGAFIVNIIFSFTYNKIFIQDLLVKGYKTTNETDAEVIKYYVNS